MKSRRGFTLIEILVAMAVLALSLGAALRIDAAGIGVMAAARTRLLAGWIAADQLAELRARRSWPDIGVTEGHANEAGQEFRWRQTVSQTPNPRFRRVSVVVYAGLDTRKTLPLVESVGHVWKGGG